MAYHQRWMNPDGYVPKLCNVTELDARKGLRGICNKCPVSLALKRLLKPGTQVDVYGSYVNMRDPETPAERWEVYLPEWPCKWIRRFDDYALSPGFPMAFTFLIDLPLALVRNPTPALFDPNDKTNYRVQELMEVR